jgi:4-hydroxybenzoate polyprenyltransferase
VKFIRTIIDALVYSNVFIALCAIALTFTNQLTVGGEIHFDYSCWFIFFSTIFTYTYLKIISSPGVVIDTGHRSWAAENAQLSRNILLISLVATIGFFFKLSGNVKLIVVVLGLVTAFYGFVTIPFSKPKMRLRDLGYVKTLFVAIVWSVTTVVVPLGDNDVSPDLMIFLLLRRFIFVLALTMVFEVKDMTGDKANNLKTLPLAMGISNTKLLAQALLLLLIIINLIQYFFFSIPLSNMVAVNLSLLLSICCIQPVREETGDLWYYLVLDGMMLVQFIFVYLGAKIFG